MVMGRDLALPKKSHPEGEDFRSSDKMVSVLERKIGVLLEA